MGLGQCILNTELLDLRQLCEIDEKQYNMGPLMFHDHVLPFPELHNGLKVGFCLQEKI